MKKTILALLVVNLAACSAPQPSRKTYDAIAEEMAKAAANTAVSREAPKPSTPSQNAVPSAVSNALLPPLQPPAPPAPAKKEDRFTVTFNDVPAKQFFMAIAANTRYNMVVHPEVAGTISANLKNVTLFEALDVIRDLYGYDYTVQGNQVAIKPLTLQTKVFQVNYLNGSRYGSSDTRVNGGTSNAGQNGATGTPGATQPANNTQTGTTPYPANPAGIPGVGTPTAVAGSRVSSMLNSDFWGDLKEALRAIVGITEEERGSAAAREGRPAHDGRSVVISRQSGVVVVRAMPAELRAVTLYLKASQLAVERQVILEAKILEVQLNDSYQAGINWASFANIGGNPAAVGFAAPGTLLNNRTTSQTQVTGLNTTNPVTGATGTTTLSATTGKQLAVAGNAAGSLFGLAFQSTNFSALLNFLETQGSVHVLSSPRIATLNNQKAILKVGTDDFFVTKVATTTQTSATGNIATPDVTLQQFFSGVVLDVTPQIDEQENITLHVHPSVTQVSTVNKQIDLGQQLGTLNLPLASSNTSETDSVVRGQNGQIIAIGGLMRQSSTNDGSQVPGAGDIPGIGGLFRSNGRQNQKRELVILIKPSIVDSNSNWAGDILESQRRIQSLDPQGMAGGQ